MGGVPPSRGLELHRHRALRLAPPAEQRIGLLIILLGFGWFVDAADAANAPLGAGYVIFPFPLVPGFLRGPSELRCHGW